MEISTLKDVINSAGYEYRSYSGRGMYGKECIGFVTDDNDYKTFCNLVRSVEFALEIDNPENAYVNVISLIDVLEDAQYDSMGMSTIVYFPRVNWEDD